MTNEEYKFFLSHAITLIERGYVQDMTADELAERLYQTYQNYLNLDLQLSK